MHKFLLSLFVLFFLGACTDKLEISQHRVTELAYLLQTLDSHIPFEAAQSLSGEIFQETDQLRIAFDPVFEPHINNFLINTGVKEKGLCYEWSDALYVHLKHKKYLHFSFHLLVADQGEYFFEHNVMVVTAKNGKVMEGVIIDPWRSPGEVYFSKVSEDIKYTWKQRKEREIP